MTVKFFGSLIEITGTSAVEVPAATDTDELRALLIQEWPALSGCTYRVCVDLEMITGNSRLADDCEVALLPPFSGG